MKYSNTQKKEKFSLLQEGVNSYSSHELDEDEYEIKIVVPKKFYNVWRVKLTDLESSLEEVEYWNDTNSK